MPGTAEAGPATGVAKAELCRAFLDCARRTRCARVAPADYSTGAADLLLGCYCKATRTNCADGVTDEEAGPCKAEVEDAMETTSASKILSSISGITPGEERPTGVAGSIILAGCDYNHCKDECLPGLCPTISSVTATPARVPTGTPSVLSVQATNPGGGELTYDWKKEGNDIGTLSSSTTKQTNYQCGSESPPNRTVKVFVGNAACVVGDDVDLTCDPAPVPDGSGGTGGTGNNQCPTVTALTAVPEFVPLDTTAIVTAVVSNPSGGVLSYSFTESQGLGTLVLPDTGSAPPGGVVETTQTTVPMQYACGDVQSHRPERRQINVQVNKQGCNTARLNTFVTCQLIGSTGGTGGTAGADSGADSSAGGTGGQQDDAAGGTSGDDSGGGD
jgi:hypothetical protein